ncbi:MAG: hypothetical protein R6W75_05035 [Smithellaceae bacterium]
MMQDNQERQSMVLDFRDNQSILKEIRLVISMVDAGYDFQRFDIVFADIEKLFHGQFPGYRPCNTYYHDFRHTLLALLAMVRLMHGASLENITFSEKELNLGLISALMHDTGYIQSIDDYAGTGAKYTLSHIGRGIIFVQKYFAGNPYFEGDMKEFHDILSCTGAHTMVGADEFSSESIALLGKMMGTADLLGQMADRLYLEKLMLLYSEFEEGEVPGFDSEIDLYRKTVSFYNRTRARFEKEFGGVIRYMQNHFKARWDIDGNVYEGAIENNINYLKFVLKSSQKDIYHSLRRNAISFQ